MGKKGKKEKKEKRRLQRLAQAAANAAKQMARGKRDHLGRVDPFAAPARKAPKPRQPPPKVPSLSIMMTRNDRNNKLTDSFFARAHQQRDQFMAGIQRLGELYGPRTSSQLLLLNKLSTFAKGNLTTNKSIQF